MNVSMREGQEADWPNFKTWCGANWFSALTERVNFNKGHDPNRTVAWAILRKLYKSTERPQVQSLMTQLTGFKIDIRGASD